MKDHLSYRAKFHHLRHTFNTRLMKARVLMDVRKDLMGHSQARQINAVYSHIDSAMRIDAIRQLEQWVAEERARFNSPVSRTGTF